MKVLRLLTCIAAISVGDHCVFAQPEGQKGDGPRQGQAAPGRNYRAQLQKRADELKERANTLENAIKRLDAGEDPATVRKELEDSMPGSRRMLGSRQFLPERVGEEPRPPDEEHGPPPNPPDGPLTPQEREKALAFLDEHLPRVAEKMRSLSSSNPVTLDRLLMRMRPKLMDLGNTARYDQELFELKVQELQGAMEVMEAARALREAPPNADRTPMREALRNAVAAHFDVQLRVSERDAIRLAERIESLRQEIGDRKARRDEFINREVEQTMKGPRPPRPSDGPHERDHDHNRDRK